MKRALSALVIALSAGAAHGFAITTQGTWSYDPSVSSLYSGYEPNLFSSSDFGSLPIPTSLTWTSTDGAFTTEIDTLTNGSSTLTLAMTQTSSLGQYNLDSTYTSTGTWVYLSGTGAYAGLTGSGEYSSYTSLTSIGSNGQLTGNSLHMVNGALAAPEPATLSGLVIGAFMLRRRRP